MSRKKLLVLLAGFVLVVPLLLVLVVNLGRDPHLIRSPLIGQPAPRFTLRPVGGGAPVSLESLRGRPVVVNFWATWCMPCRDEHPALQAAARRYGRDVTFLGVVYEDEESNVSRVSSVFPVLMDPGSRAALAYGVQGVPETYFINREGVIVAKYAAPLEPETIDALVAQASGQ